MADEIDNLESPIEERELLAAVMADGDADGEGAGRGGDEDVAPGSRASRSASEDTSSNAPPSHSAGPCIWPCFSGGVP